MSSLTIDHQPIPRKQKTTSANSKYTLDLKDIPQDIGGGVALEETGGVNDFIGSVIVVIVLSSLVYVSFASKQDIDKY